MLETVTDEKKKRGELKAKRDSLFEKYLKDPRDTQLSLEIESIDDQLAESNKPVKRTIKRSN